MKKVELSNVELRALKILLSNSVGCCSSGCAFEKMQDSKMNCSECKFTKAINSIETKIGIHS
jgi:hypothetical protein